MATLIIRKVLGGIWEHEPSDAPLFILSNWYVKVNVPYFQLQEIGGSQRKIYLISQITVFDINGGPETFANFTALMVRLKALDYTAFEQGSGGGGVVINDNTPSLTEVYSSQKVEDELDLIALEILEKQNIPRLVDADTTALNNEILHVTADATITDVADAITGNFFTVRVLSGIATVDGVAYGVGTLIARNYDGTVWTNSIQKNSTIIFSDTSFYQHTGTTANTLIGQLDILGGIIQDGDVWEVSAAASRNSTNFAGRVDLQVKFEDAVEATGFIRGSSLGTSDRSIVGWNRRMMFKNGNIYRLSQSGAQYSDFLTQAIGSSIVAFDLSVPHTLSYFLQSTNVSDTSNLHFVIFRKIN
jgi:hypothetical protein